MTRQRGIGLVAAIFVITVMAVVAAAISRLVVQNAQATTEQIALTRALYAAESGAGLALNTLYPTDEYPGYAGQSCSTLDHEFDVDGLAGCAVTVTCSEYAEPAGVRYFSIASTGRCDSVERVVHVQSRFEP